LGRENLELFLGARHGATQTIRLCQNLFPKRNQSVKLRTDWDIHSKRIKLSETERFCYSVFKTLTQNQKMHHCVIRLKHHQILESAGPNSKQSKKFTRKSVGFNFAA